MGARHEKAESHDPEPIGAVDEPAPPQLAEGTRRDIDVQRTKGICIATRCHTVEQFVATFHRYCEDAAIFVPNARRAVGTILPFSFELADEEAVLVGLGKVVEEFTTVHNRFGRAGIVIAVQKLKRESIAVFEKMRAARKSAEAERHTPPPIFARSVTGTIALDEVRKAVRAPTLPPFEVKIPNPGEKPAKPRANTMLGVPVIPKVPAKQPIMQIPAIVPRADAKGSRTYSVPDATPRPVFDGADTFVEAVPEAIPDPFDVGQDTERDEVPFALRNELRVLERAPVVPQIDVDEGWDVPSAAAELGAQAAPELDAMRAPEVILEPLQEVVSEPVRVPVLVTAEPEAVTFIEAPAPPRQQIEAATPIAAPPQQAIVVEDAIPTAIPAAPSDAATTPRAEMLAEDTEANPMPEAPYPWWHHPVRWLARVTIASTLFVASAAITASVGTPTLPVAAEPAPVAVESAITPAPDQKLTDEAPAAACVEPTVESQQCVAKPAPASSPAVEPQQSVAEPSPAVEPAQKVAEPAPAPPPKAAPQERAPTTTARPIARPVMRRVQSASKKPCNDLDCL